MLVLVPVEVPEVEVFSPVVVMPPEVVAVDGSPAGGTTLEVVPPEAIARVGIKKCQGESGEE